MKYQRIYSLALTAAVLISACMLGGCEKKNDDSTPKDTTAVSHEETNMTETGTNTTGGNAESATQSVSDTSSASKEENSIPMFSTEEGEIIMTVTTPKHTSAATIAGSKSDDEPSESTKQTSHSAASESAASTEHSAQTSTTATSAAVPETDDGAVELPFVPFN